MGQNIIRVLVVDDLALIREMISDYIAEAPGVEVAGTAADGKEALKVFDKVQPDLVTLDIQMPKMNGLETLDALLARRPVPVIMLSALTQLGADITLEALERGALDYVAKPDGNRNAQECLRDDLLRKIRSMAGTDLKKVLEIRHARAQRNKDREAKRKIEVPPPVTQDISDREAELADKCIAIGISTGGPPALATMFESLRPPLPPIVIVQHMPPHFTKAFARRLNTISQIEVKEAETGDMLRVNHAYIAQGGKHLQIRRAGRSGKLVIRDGDSVSGHKPSADVMMASAAEIFGDRCLGMIMTGMGRDGSDGCGAIRAAGGFVLGQDEDTSDVYGMNKVAFVEGNVDRQFGLEESVGTISIQINRMWAPATAPAK